jgi:acyl-CoA thioesterase II
VSETLDELIAELRLERIEENLFRGQSQDLGWGTVFGGQVLCQALAAAAATVGEGRLAHSLHAYFLRPGDVNRAVVYTVDRIRDGGSFTTRRVVATQAGHAIFNLAASFQKHEQGFTHQLPMPSAPDPLSVPTEQERFAAMGERLPSWLRWRVTAKRAFETRMVDVPDDMVSPPRQEPRRLVWMRGLGRAPDDPALSRALLAYVSDFAFITTALLPHGVSGFNKNMQVASLDHVMWFHHTPRLDDWHLYVMESPAAQGARGFARGSLFRRDGLLVATTAQEGLTRLRES